MGDKHTKRGKSSSRKSSGSSTNKKSGKKKSAKERKRELETMYGSGGTSKYSKQRSKSRKNQQAASRFGESEGSIGIEDLEVPQHKQSQQSKKRPSASKTKQLQKSKHMSYEQSLDLDQIMMQQSTMGRSNHLQRGRSQRGGAPPQRPSSQHTPMQRQASSRPSMQRGRSQDRSISRPGLSGNRGQSVRQSMMRSNSVNPSTSRGRGLTRGQSSRRGQSLDRSTSTTMNASSFGGSNNLNGPRSRSMSARRGGTRPTSLGQHLDRQKSMARSKSKSMMRSKSGSKMDFSFHGSGSFVSDVISINGQKGRVVLQPVSADDQKRLNGGKGGYIRRFIPYKEPEERPPRSLILIWLVVSAELGFDLGTTIIAFKSFVEEDTCCGRPITLGPIPVASTIPFFLLIVAELALLIRAIVLTMWPSLLHGDDSTELDMEDLELGGKKEPEKRSCFRRYLCCILRLKLRVLMQILNLLVLMNPFFGCIIAWILMYQSDKREAFIVLGMEGASLILHYISCCLEGTLKTFKGFLINSIPVIPFSVSIGLVLWYLKQGGVCYLVEARLFKFTGCEICNITGVLQPCPNATNLFTGITEIGSLDEARDRILERNSQATYCSAETNFCFFDFNDGQVPDVNANATAAPSELLFPTDPPATITTPDDPPAEVPGEDDFQPTSPPEPTVDETTVAPTPIPTVAPTPAPTEPEPQAEPEPEPAPGPGPGSGSDGFNPGDTGSDGFNMDDLFGRKLYV
mmetsp:Transcript_48977/g.118605  ORF Transcript_48977/g.118605 Transcript_48977/m.118605 type:complete len:742 (-) Transcript_48977:399-2624(-)